MRNVWLSICVGIPLVGGSFVVGEMNDRIAELESAPRVDPAAIRELGRELAQLESQVARSLASLDDLSAEQKRTAALDEHIAAVRCELEDAGRDLAEQRARLEQWDELREQIGPRAVDARFELFKSHVEDRWNALGELARSAMGTAASANANLDELTRNLRRDPGDMWHDLLGPTVQLMGEETVGTGVLLASEPIPNTDEYVTYVLTAWHVIRDIQSTPDSGRNPVPVTIYAQDGSSRTESAHLLRYDAALDVALLKLESKDPVEAGAKLASREQLANVKIFERIYAVGCPLGNDPIPTYGEIADTHHKVDGQRYWMISAPTYIGNSGGGVFDADTHELLGIFTKIYTHGSLRPTVVPHMGLATPLPMIYDWLDSVGYASLEPASTGATRTAAAAR